MSDIDDFVVDDTLFKNDEKNSIVKSSNTFSTKAEYIHHFKLNKFHVYDLDAKLHTEHMQENDTKHRDDIEYQLQKKTLENKMCEQLIEKKALGHNVTDFMKLGDILKKYDPTIQAKSIDEFENKMIYITQLKQIEKNFSKDKEKEDIVQGFQINGYDEYGNEITIMSFAYMIKNTCQLLLENIENIDGRFKTPIECKVVSEFKKRANRYNDWYKTYKLVGM